MNVKIDKDMLTLARRQFCLDIGMDYAEYEADPDRNVYLVKTTYADGNAAAAAGARYIAGTDFGFRAMICMGQLFVCVDERLYGWALEFFRDAAPEWLCEFGTLRIIDRKLNEIGLEIEDTHVYFLPEEETIGENFDPIKAPEGSAFDYLLFEEDEIELFRGKNRFTSALCFSPTQPDVIAIAAFPGKEKPEEVQCTDTGVIHVDEDARTLYDVRGEAATETGNCECGDVQSKSREAEDAVRFDQSRMAGMSGASRDGAYLWQIGINVDKTFGGRGLASDLVRRIKNELIKRGCTPFYGTAESHVLSRSVALKAGFVPAWTEIYVRRRS